ncbi:MAG: glycosyltransferase family 4 protein [Ktedonobacterales bacterium]|nr:glycosyltransferase family 4 protein [Ktedonobacterales bacterium]
MAHVLFLTPYYPPEVGAPQNRISETALRLVRVGHKVTVLTTLPNYPSGIVPPEYRKGQRRLESIDGVTVVRTWSAISPNKGFLRRILSQLSFGLLAHRLGKKALKQNGRPDIIIVESPPLFDAFGGRALSRRYRAPYIFCVADIWPESAVQLGALRNKLLIWLAERLEWSAYQRSGAVWAVTAGIRQELIDRGLSPEKVFLLPNGVDTQRFHPMPHAEARAVIGWDSRFTVVYAGTMGLAHGLTTLLAAADHLREREDIRFVLIGEGAAKADLIAEAHQRALPNVTFLSAQPHQRMPLIINSADACLASLKNVPLFQGALPSKMYEAMACARPILLAVNGEAQKVIEQEAGAALHVEPENAEALAQGILTLCEHPELAQRLGANGRTYVLEHFDRDKLVVRLERQIETLLASRSTKRRRISAPASVVEHHS